MPNTSLWGKESNQDIQQLLSFILEKQSTFEIQLSPVLHSNTKAQGIMWGGCLSILCSLLGTPYLPQSKENIILFVEDTNESPARILRSWTQILQSNLIDNISGVLFGNFRNLGEDIDSQELKLYLAKLCNKPCWSSDELGHCSPNYPIQIGALASIRKDVLQWNRL